jgi:uncharacterized hydrophobic protein (TIGR00271 family)
MEGTRLWINIKRFFVNLIDIKSDANIDGTVEGIKKDIDFKGQNVWILICSILIASIGLNTNSIPVIIGAMLIAPLMGPILGIGLSVGTNDYDTLKRSIRAFLIMTGIGLVTSWIYFSFTPITKPTAEILARTSPTFLDAMIALFGGIAGIVAGSRREKSNVVPGVAIATALMPPLCTAGYGLAMGNLDYFLGAGYLFVLNSFLIALATYMGIEFLGFPHATFVDKARGRRVKAIITSKAERFIGNEIRYSGSEIINQKINYSEDSTSIELFLMGEIVPKSIITTWKGQMPNYDLEDAHLYVYQSKDATEDIAGKLSEKVRIGIIEDIYDKQSERMKSKDERIAFLEDELVHYKKSEIPLEQIIEEVKINNWNVERIDFAQSIGTDFFKYDTIPTFIIDWEDETEYDSDKLQKWLQVRLNEDSVRIINL